MLWAFWQKLKLNQGVLSVRNSLSHLIRSKGLAASVPKLIPNMPTANTLSTNAFIHTRNFRNPCSWRPREANDKEFRIFQQLWGINSSHLNPTWLQFNHSTLVAQLNKMSNHFKVQNYHQLYFQYSWNEQIIKLNNIGDPVAYVAWNRRCLPMREKTYSILQQVFPYNSAENTEGSC